jgi:proton-dependent oligopeptide transporter, POT family
VIFWQEFISLPLFLRGYIDPNSNVDLLLATDSLAVICFQILVSYMTRRIRSFTAMTLGILISSLSWLVLALHANLPALAGIASAVVRPFGVTEAIHASSPAVVFTLIVLALGEMTLSPRYYEYVSRLAPSGQQGLYMGYAFLPIAIGYFIAGPLGGYLVHHFGDVLNRPQQMWFVITAIGILTTLLMWIYDRVFKPGQAAAAAG